MRIRVRRRLGTKLLRASGTLLLALANLLPTAAPFAAGASTPPPLVRSTPGTGQQSPKQVEYYRKSAAAYRKAAEKVPDNQKACYIQWANYYDCLADQLETGKNRGCGEPGCKPGQSGSATPTPRRTRPSGRRTRSQ